MSNSKYKHSLAVLGLMCFRSTLLDPCGKLRALLDCDRVIVPPLSRFHLESHPNTSIFAHHMPINLSGELDIVPLKLEGVLRCCPFGSIHSSPRQVGDRDPKNSNIFIYNHLSLSFRTF